MLTGEKLGSALRSAIKLKGVSISEVAREFRIKSPSVHDWMKHGRIGKQHLELLVSYFADVVQPSHWGLSGTYGTDEPGWNNITAYAQAASLGDGAKAQEYAETNKLKFKESSLRKKGLTGRKLSVFYGSGDSMLPRFHDGDAMLFDEDDKQPKHKKVFIIRMDDDMYFAKRAKIVNKVVYFESDNPDGDHNWQIPKRMDDPADPIEVVGRVRWIGSWED